MKTIHLRMGFSRDVRATQEALLRIPKGVNDLLLMQSGFETMGTESINNTCIYIIFSS
jgi:hypothetical protein